MHRFLQLFKARMIAMVAVLAATLPAAAAAHPYVAHHGPRATASRSRTAKDTKCVAKRHRTCKKAHHATHKARKAHKGATSAASANVRRRHQGSAGPPPSTPSTAESPAAPTPPATPSVEVPVLTITGTTYYVSRNGSDSNSGTSPSSPWRTVKRVNAATLAPGDGVLFEGGATFSEEALMPRSSGASGSPIVFGSYGTGDASLPLGVWFKEHDGLAFEHLTFSGESSSIQGTGIQGTGSDVTIEWCSIGNDSLPVHAMGSEWTIDENTINHAGNSGMLLEGENFTVSGNTITDTGLDPSITWGKHGIYLKASNATVTDNTITSFNTDGISVRYRNSVLAGNTISGGPIGIGWFQYDPIAGTSHWTSNKISNTTVAGIYVSATSGDAEMGDLATKESFVIEYNTIDPAAGVEMNLETTSGTYETLENTLI
jgi:parallel beta-helix repeat protein